MDTIAIYSWTNQISKEFCDDLSSRGYPCAFVERNANLAAHCIVNFAGRTFDGYSEHLGGLLLTLSHNYNTMIVRRDDGVGIKHIWIDTRRFQQG